jgi:AmpD protein
VKNDHCLYRVPMRESPHCNERPDCEDIALVVIHGISLPAGQFGGRWVDALFAGSLSEQLPVELESLRGLNVSAHLFIDREGQIIQYVAFDKRAWHAGESCWRGRAGCNDYAIGIELEGSDHAPYTERQYAALRAATLALFARYRRLSVDAVAGHQEVAPGRKSDPGPAFDWARYLGGLCERRL